jgi:hypothetical protein
MTDSGSAAAQRVAQLAEALLSSNSAELFLAGSGNRGLPHKLTGREANALARYLVSIGVEVGSGAGSAPSEARVLRKAFAAWVAARREAEEVREARIIADAQAGIPVGASPTSAAEKLLWEAEGLAHGRFFGLLEIADVVDRGSSAPPSATEAVVRANDAAWGETLAVKLEGVPPALPSAPEGPYRAEPYFQGWRVTRFLPDEPHFHEGELTFFYGNAEQRAYAVRDALNRVAASPAPEETP